MDVTGSSGGGDGIRVKGIKRYPRSRNLLDNISYGEIKPVSGTNLKTQEIILFEFNTGHAYIRLSKNPIYVKYQVEKLKTKGEFPQEASQLYLNPALGASTFFDGAEVELDNQVVSSSTNSFGFLYQACNRYLSKTAMREEHYGWGGEVTNKSTETKALQPYIRGAAAIHGESKAAVGVKGARCSIDGVPFLSHPKNLALAAMHDIPEEDNEFTFFPPGTKVVVRLLRASPHTKNVACFFGTVAQYLASEAAGDGLDSDTAEVTINDLTLCYEAVDFGRNIQVYGPKGFKAVYDSPYISLGLLAGKQSRTQNTFTIPSGTKAAYMVFLKQHQLYYNSTYKKNTEAIFSFPNSLKKLTVKLNGKTICWPEGLGRLGGPTAIQHSDVYTLHSMYRELGIVDGDIKLIFPGTDEGVKQVLFLPLCNFKYTTGSQLEFDGEWNAAASPENYYIAVFFVVENILTKDKHEWKVRTAD